jgi:hypothetical protein
MSEIKSKKCKKSKKWAENEFFLPFSLQMFAVGRLAVYIGVHQTSKTTTDHAKSSSIIYHLCRR